LIAGAGMRFFLGFVLLMGVVMASVSRAEVERKPQALKVCPDSPNCVSSDAPEKDTEHYIKPLVFAGDPQAAWQAVKEALLALPRCEIVVEREGYLHAECRSFLFRFVDDLELQLRVEDGLIAVRSASRVGRSDFGVNRKRVEGLRDL